MNIALQIILLISVVLIPGILTYSLKSINPKSIKLLLSFSGGFLLSIAFLHFIPEIYHNNSSKIGIFILLGFLVQVLLEILSKGIEHGHAHIQTKSSAFTIMMVGLSLHALIEGFPLASSYIDKGHHDHSASFSILTGILIHKLPIAISLTTLMLGLKMKLKSILVYLAIFAIMAPIGLLSGEFLSKNELLNPFVLDALFAVVIGMLLHISTTIIFESSEGHKFNSMKFVSILIGFGIAILLN